MKIETTAYRFAHGKAPNGREPGSWAFDFYRGGLQEFDTCEVETIFVPGPMKLADAKRWAQETARAMPDVTMIQVAP